MYEYGARWYDPVIGRFTGVDPAADQFPWVSTYNYAENEPVANIDLWGLQKYKPQMQPIDKPSDLLSLKMLRNTWEGVKTVAIEGASIAKDGFSYARNQFNDAGKWIQGQLRAEGNPKSSDFEDENYTHSGTGIETLSDTPLNSNGTQALPNAKGGATAIFSENELNAIKPGEAGGVMYDAANKASVMANAIENLGLGISEGKDAADMIEQNRSPKKPKIDSMVIRFTPIPGSREYKRDTVYDSRYQNNQK